MNAVNPKGFLPFAARPIEDEEAAEALLKQQISFEGDRVANTERTNRRLWKALGVAMVAIGLQGWGNGLLANFQHFIPIVMIEHESNGFVERQFSQSGDGITDAAAINGMNARTYVTAREQYFHGLWDTDFQTVTMLSSPEEQKRLAHTYAKDSANDPRTIYGDKGQVKIDRVGTPTLMSSVKDQAKAGVMQVIFRRTVSTDGENSSKPEQWIATFHFERHPNAKIAADAVTVNPFGWVVTEYNSHRM